MAPDAATTLADLVADQPARAEVLDRLGLDYCCHGQRPLGDAARDAGLQVETVLRALDVPDGPVSDGWQQLGLADLAAHVVETHHHYLWVEMPRLEELATKVASVHGDRHPEVAVVRELVGALRADLEPHMTKEERVLFPAIGLLETGAHEFPFGHIANPVRMMCSEHEHAGALLEQLRTTTSGYRVPADGCASYRSLYERLVRLEADTHLHIHKENNVLFPAAIARFDALAAASDEER
jgi:regulator of cell morphogenesis and NO signaling